MNERVYLTGSTVRLECTFKDFDGNPFDPTIVKINIYNYKHELKKEFILGDGNKTGLGHYVFDYQTSDKEERIIYEWYGEKEGNKVIDRDDFVTRFLK